MRTLEFGRFIQLSFTPGMFQEVITETVSLKPLPYRLHSSIVDLTHGLLGPPPQLPW